MLININPRFLNKLNLINIFLVLLFSQVLLLKSNSAFAQRNTNTHNQPQLSLRHKIYVLKEGVDFNDAHLEVVFNSNSAFFTDRRVSDDAAFSFSSSFPLIDSKVSSDMKEVHFSTPAVGSSPEILDSGINEQWNIKLTADEAFSSTANEVRGAIFRKDYKIELGGYKKINLNGKSYEINPNNCKSEIDYSNAFIWIPESLRELDNRISAFSAYIDISEGTNVFTYITFAHWCKLINFSDDKKAGDVFIIRTNGLIQQNFSPEFLVEMTDGILGQPGTSDESNQNPNSQSECIDSDGDGWGWDGENSCRVDEVSSAPSPSNSNSECIDSDGDGWGWDGNASCRITQPTPNNNPDVILACIHSGGWWNRQRNRCETSGAS